MLRVNLSLHLKTPTRQPRLSLNILLTSLRTQQVIQPSTIRLDLDSSAVHDSQVQPSSSIADCPDLIRDMSPSILAHLSVKPLVSVDIEEMLRDSIVIARCSQESGLAVYDLERNTTSTASDDRLAGVESFGNLDLKAFTGGQLKSNACVRHERIQDYTEDTQN